MASGAPDVISSFGFAQAPVSRFLVLASGFTSVTVSLLPRRYQSLFTLHWSDVLNKKQVWRLVSSQFVTDNHVNIVSNCVLIYYFLVLERRFGSAKYISFLIKTWSLSLGLYYIIMKSNLLEAYIPHAAVAPNGLYGPLAALLVHYCCDIPKGENSGPFGLQMSRKIFVYLVALQMFITSEKSIVMSICGIISGLVHKFNILQIQHWTLPKFINHTKVLSYFLKSETTSKRAYMGATVELHEDIMFDHMMRRQQQVFRRGNGGRTHLGQGYSDVINPSFMNSFRPPPPPVNSEADVASELASDEKIRTLVDMGFSRDAVINALASSNNDIQQATTILLSPH